MGPNYKAMIGIHVHNSHNSRQKNKEDSHYPPPLPRITFFTPSKIWSCTYKISKGLVNMSATIVQINSPTMNQLSDAMHVGFYILVALMLLTAWKYG